MTDTKDNLILMYPCADGWDAQGSHDGGAIDIGWLSKCSKDGKTDIYASADGVVEGEGWYYQKYGGREYKTLYVAIRHPLKDKDIITIYWHLSRTLVDVGQKVKQGDVIGKKGSTGNSTGVHLHYQCLELEKGKPLPDNTNGIGRTKYTFYPVPYMRVFPGTIFESRGNYTIKPYEPKAEVKTEVDLTKVKELLDEAKSILESYGRLYQES